MSRHGALLHGVLSVETEAMKEAQRPSVTPGSQTTLLLCSSSLPTSAPHSVSVLLVLGSYDTLICHSWDLLDVGVRYPEFCRKPPLQCWHSLANTLKDFPWTRPSQAYSPFFLLLPILSSPLRPANTQSLHRFKPSTLIVWGSKKKSQFIYKLFTIYWCGPSGLCSLAISTVSSKSYHLSVFGDMDKAVSVTGLLLQTYGHMFPGSVMKVFS